MARIPTIEGFLSKIKEATGNPDVASKLETLPKKDFFERTDIEKYDNVFRFILKSIAECYDIDIKKIKHLDIEIVSTDKDLEIAKNFATILRDYLAVIQSFQIFDVWTFNATKKQVIYEIAKYIMPMFGRRYGFSDSVSHDYEYMPYGSLWFLPRIDEDNPKKLILPMRTAINWWDNLLGGVDAEIWNVKDGDNYVKNLYNWRKGIKLPKNNQIIKKMFADDIKFIYKNNFIDDKNKSLGERFEKAKNFYDTKNNNKNSLIANPNQYAPNRYSHRFSDIYIKSHSENSSDVSKEKFISFIQEMWRTPNNLEIRRIFTSARLAEYSYRQMCDLLNSNKEIYHNANPQENKTLQLVGLFKFAYDLTIKTNHRNDRKAYAQFNDAVPQWLKETYFKGLIHDGYGDKNVAEEVATLFHDKMLTIDSNTPLDDIFHNGKLENGQSIANIQSNEIEKKRREFNENIVEKLESEVKAQPTLDSKNKIDALIRQARSHDEYKTYKAIILYCQSMYALRQNKFNDALKFADEAFTECTLHNSYGEYKESIAKLYITIYLFQHHYHKKLEKYAMTIAEFEDKNFSITDENGKKLPIEYISDKLAFIAEAQIQLIKEIYQPYPSYEKEVPPSQLECDKLSQEYSKNIQTDDKEFKQWVKNNQKRIQKTIIPYKNNFAAWSYNCYLFPLQYGRTDLLNDSGGKKWKTTIIRLVKECNLKTLDAQNYLEKTLLIYAVEAEDIEMVEALLQKGVDVNIQDHVKKTALHRAVAKKNIKIFKLLVDHNASLVKKDAFGESVIDDIIQSDFSEAMQIILKHREFHDNEKIILTDMGNKINQNLDAHNSKKIKLSNKEFHIKWSNLLKPYIF